MIAAHCIPYVLRESHTLNVLQSRTHGLDHWFRVWKNAQMLGVREPGVDMEVVALFCLFHDAMRANDGEDPKHGLHGYMLWVRFCQLNDMSKWFSENQGEMLFEACIEHSDGQRSSNPTIAVCWDADRLDHHRLGIWPDSQYMSTSAAISLIMTRLP